LGADLGRQRYPPRTFEAKFFEYSLPVLLSEYAQHRNLDVAKDVLVTARLRNGDEFFFTGGRWTTEVMAFFTPEDHMRLVPFVEIIGIDIRKRTDETLTGFTLPTAAASP
jgi:hypothetical protein